MGQDVGDNGFDLGDELGWRPRENSVPPETGFFPRWKFFEQSAVKFVANTNDDARD
jgi:hypothetical protein